MNELVIIGQGLNKTKIMLEPEACLCNAAEIEAMEKGKSFKDSFPI
jgi:hypothetical protein